MTPESEIRGYFYELFPGQLRLLGLKRPSRVVVEKIMRDPYAAFFGGRDWASVRTDLHPIPKQDRSKFVLLLFMLVLTDQAIYTYFRYAYDDWRASTRFPKFGWSGFGPRNENPFKILWAPEREGVIDPSEMQAIMPEFASFLVDEVSAYFCLRVPQIDVGEFFLAIQRDRAYQFDLSQTATRFKSELESMLDDRWPVLRQTRRKSIGMQNRWKCGSRMHRDDC